MGELSKIEWTDHTFNPWIGCQKVSPGCDHCYAEAMMDHRYGRVKWGPHGERVRTSAANWRKPVQWARAANGSRPRVFCASLADWLDNKAPQSWREDLAVLIDATPQLDWLLLTKRIENFDRLAPWHRDDVPANVWLGVTVEDQAAADKRISILAGINARVRFLSCEPMLSPISLRAVCKGCPGGHSDCWIDGAVHWVICGGESGRGARDMAAEWARALRDECDDLGVPFFMKQLGARCAIPGVTGKGDDPMQWPADLRVREFPRG